MSKELTPMELLFLEIETLEDAMNKSGDIPFANTLKVIIERKEVAIQSESTFIRKKEREAAEKGFNAGCNRINWLEDENPTNEVPNREEFIDKTYPL